MKVTKRLLAVFIAVVMLIGTFSVAFTAFAATKVTSIKLDKTSATVYMTKTLTLKATVSPSNASNKKVTWSTSNSKVATVSSSGVVTPKKAGTVTITCKAADGSGKKATCKVTVKKAVLITSIKLNASSKTVYKGDTYQLKVSTVKPSNATNKKYTWSSSDKKIATVSSTGVVKGVKAGTVTITCKAADGSGKKATCKVTIKNPVLIKTIKLNATNKTINSGKTVQLKVSSVTPSNASIKKYTWSSSNTKVATVSSSGLVTGVKGGTVTITCKAADGSGKKATCKVTVRQSVTKVALSKTSLTLSKGGTSTLKATITPSNAYNKAVKWTSSNEKVAKVSSSGKVTAVANGTATITCKAADGSGKKATCKVTVATVKATSVKLSKTSVTIYPAQSTALTATVSPSNTTDKTLKWTSSDPSVATVDSNGVVRGVKSGTTTITATTKDGSNKKATCKVTVGVKANSITVAGPEGDNTNYWYVGRTGKLTASVIPLDATNTAVTWSSSNTKYATVDANGNVKAIACDKTLTGKAKEAKVTITATAKDGSGVKGTYTFTIRTKKTNVSSITAVPSQDPTKENWYVGETYIIGYSFGTPAPSNQGVTFSSSNSSVATIDSKGRVKVLKEGEVTFTVTSVDDTTKKATVSVKVLKPSITSYISENKDYKVGSTIPLFSSLQPYRLTDHYGQLKYESENTEVAVIVPSTSTATANITFVGAGTTRVRALTSDGKIVGNWVTVRAKDLIVEQDFFDGAKIGDHYKIEAYLFNGTRLNDEVEVFLIGESQYYLDYDVDTKEIYVISDLPESGVRIRLMTKDGIYSKDAYFMPNKYVLPTGDNAALLSKMKQYDSELRKNLTKATLTEATDYTDVKVDNKKSSFDLGMKIETRLFGSIPIPLEAIMKMIEKDGENLDDVSVESFVKELYSEGTKNKSEDGKNYYPAALAVDAADVSGIEVANDKSSSRYYTMKLKLKSTANGIDLSSVASSAYGKAMPVIDQAFIDETVKQMKSIEESVDGETMKMDEVSAGTIKQTYSDGYVTFTIDKVTDKVVKSEYHYNSFVDVSNAKFYMSAKIADMDVTDILKDLFGIGVPGGSDKTTGTVSATVKYNNYFTMNVNKTLTFDNIAY